MSRHNETTAALGLVDPVAMILPPRTRVTIRAFTAGSRKADDLGVGSLVDTPRVGIPLSIRIRRERGLTTSPTLELRVLSSTDIAARTESSVYVLSILDAQEELTEAEIAHLVADLVALPVSDENFLALTDYIRLDEELIESSVSRRAHIFVFRGGDQGTRTDMGIGLLLEEPTIGDPARFTDEHGSIRTTSDVIAIDHTAAPNTIRVETKNSLYEFRLTEPC